MTGQKTRRRYLAGLATVGAGSLAGCAWLDDFPDRDDEHEPPAPTDQPPEPTGTQTVAPPPNPNIVERVEEANDLLEDRYEVVDPDNTGVEFIRQENRRNILRITFGFSDLAALAGDQRDVNLYWAHATQEGTSVDRGVFVTRAGQTPLEELVEDIDEPLAAGFYTALDAVGFRYADFERGRGTHTFSFVDTRITGTDNTQLSLHYTAGRAYDLYQELDLGNAPSPSQVMAEAVVADSQPLSAQDYANNIYVSEGVTGIILAGDDYVEVEVEDVAIVDRQLQANVRVGEASRFDDGLDYVEAGASYDIGDNTVLAVTEINPISPYDEGVVFERQQES